MRAEAPLRSHRLTQALLALACVAPLAPSARAAAPTPSVAVDPALAALLVAARSHDADLAAAAADQRAVAADARVESAGLWPRLDVSAGYTRNQSESKAVFPSDTGTREVVIVPFDQLEATARVTVPLLDLGRRARVDAGELRAAAAAATTETRRATLDEAVATAWHQGLMAQAARDIAKAEVESAEGRAGLAETRRAAGFADGLEVARAAADLARTRQSVADAELDLAAARRDLTRLTGQVPTFPATPRVGPAPAGEDDASAWLARVDALPQVLAQRRTAEAARAGAAATGLELVPRVDGFVAERLTNASGFGESSNLSAGVTATFALGLDTFRRADEQAATALAASHREEAARRAAADRIRALLDTIAHREQKILTARAELEAQQLAASIAEKRWRDGGGTQLDATLAARDRQTAELTLARAELELGLARTLLAIAAGLDLAHPQASP